MKKLCILCLLLLVLLGACSSRGADWGSFTPDKTESFDQRYYALQTTNENSIVVTVYDKTSGKEVFPSLPQEHGIFGESAGKRTLTTFGFNPAISAFFATDIQMASGRLMKAL